MATAASPPIPDWGTAAEFWCALFVGTLRTLLQEETQAHARLAAKLRQHGLAREAVLYQPGKRPEPVWDPTWLLEPDIIQGRISAERLAQAHAFLADRAPTRRVGRRRVSSELRLFHIWATYFMAEKAEWRQPRSRRPGQTPRLRALAHVAQQFGWDDETAEVMVKRAHRLMSSPGAPRRPR